MTPTAAARESNGSIDLSPLVAWQAELAREAAAGRGIDALRLILTSIRDRYADDEPKLLEAIQEINGCAHRHLGQHREYETIELLFDAVFDPGGIELQDSLDSNAINNDAEAEIRRLSELSLVQYERERVTVAERLGMRASVLDAAVKSARPTDTKGQGALSSFAIN